MRKEELIKRYALFIVSLFFQGLGIALAKHGGLGVTPISSVANVANARWPELSMGTWLMIWNCVLILGQIVGIREGTVISALLTGPVVKLYQRHLTAPMEKLLIASAQKSPEME